MKRYGDNLSPRYKLEELDPQHEGSEKVIYGGCGVRFATFTRPVQHTPARKTKGLFSFLRFGRNKDKAE